MSALLSSDPDDSVDSGAPVVNELAAASLLSVGVPVAASEGLWLVSLPSALVPDVCSAPVASVVGEFVAPLLSVGTLSVL